jgi:hypothetical protein
MMGVVLKLLVLGFVAGLEIRDDDSRGLGESTGVDMVKPSLFAKRASNAGIGIIGSRDMEIRRIRWQKDGENAQGSGDCGS